MPLWGRIGNVMREVVAQTITEILSDPDENLELRDDLRMEIQQSLATVEAGGQTVPADTVAARLGLTW